VCEIKDGKNSDWSVIKERKQEIGGLLLKMADTALYRAKTTCCIACNYTFGEKESFKTDKCPRCGNGNLLRGRDKIMVFSENSSPET